MIWRFAQKGREYLVAPPTATIGAEELRRGFAVVEKPLPWEAWLADPAQAPKVRELLGKALGLSFAPAQIEPAVAALHGACAKGKLVVLVLKGFVGSWTGYVEPEPPPPEPAPFQPIAPAVQPEDPEPEEKNWIEVQVVDSQGNPLGGLGYRFTGTDGSEDEGTLGSAGNLYYGDIPGGDCTLSLFEKVDEPAEDEASPPVPVPPEPGEELVEVTPPGMKTVQLLEFEDAFFRTKSSVLLPELQEAPADSAEGEPPPSATGLVATCLQYAADHPDKKLLVAGHTDTTGNDAYNIPLSKNRAWAVVAAIAGDREGFKDACDGPHLSGKQEKSDVTLKDRLQILDWVSLSFGWPCGFAQNSNDYFRAVRAFQQSYNENDKAGNPEGEALEVDGDWGKMTWGAVYDCYEARLRESLGVDQAGLADYRSKLQFVDAGTPYTGCGEYHPIDNLGADNYRSQANRRVEVQFFDPGEEPSLLCFAGGCAQQACVLYDLTQYDRKHLPPGGVIPAKDRVRIRLLDIFARPIPGAPFELELAGAKQSGSADAEGWALVKDPPAQPTPAKLRWGWPPEEGQEPNLAYQTELTLGKAPPEAESDEIGAARRLKALGYWHHPEPKHNILLFQLAYGLPQTGELPDIKEDLWRYHDTGSPEPLPSESAPEDEP